MLRSILGLLAVGALFVVVSSKKCVDGKNNVIKIYDTTKGKGKILVKDLQIGTYDKNKKPICADGKPQFTFPGNFKVLKGECTPYNKKPICADGKPQFTFPGNFKVLKGTIEVVEPLKKGEDKIMVEVSLEKNSFMIGVVCEKGVSKNQFVPNEMCKLDLCEISSMCDLLTVRTPAPVEITSLIQKEFIDFGPMPIPQLGGEWKLSVNLVQGKKKLAGLRVGTVNEWLTIESIDDTNADDEPEETAHEESEAADHEEL
ncbi:unnamed protein product [Haemonchus placei]|uniref:Uncharacterized protein n=1 Tax=Haemonchus placei TaxID=6290 RepID=A0A0N4WKV4_HAEPC|nr:unnamed protein product [Haemonchus placei]